MAFFKADTRPYGTYTQYGVQSRGNRIFTIVGLVLLILVIISGAFLILNAINSGPKNDFMAMTAQEDNLYIFVAAQRDNVQNQDLHKINADAQILLASSSISLHNTLQVNYGSNLLPDNVVANAQDTTSAGKLKDASLINKFDTVYKGILQDKISNLQVSARSTQREISDPASSKAIEKLLYSLQTLAKQLNDLAL